MQEALFIEIHAILSNVDQMIQGEVQNLCEDIT